MDSTAALDLPDLPKSLLVVGGGYIGLELGTVYATLGCDPGPRAVVDQIPGRAGARTASAPIATRKRTPSASAGRARAMSSGACRSPRVWVGSPSRTPPRISSPTT